MKRAFKLLLVAVMITTVSCMSEEGNENKEKENMTVQNEPETGFQNEGDDAFLFALPSPEEIFSHVQSENLVFNEKLVCELIDANELDKLEQQSIYLGLYTADLTYIILTGQTELAKEYYRTIWNLCEKTNLSGAFDIDVLNRAWDNINNKDSLATIANESYIDVFNYLNENELYTQLAHIAYAAFTESLYVLIENIDEFSPEDVRISAIADQKMVLEMMSDYLVNYINDEEFIQNIDKISAIFDQVISVKTEPNEAESGLTLVKNSSINTFNEPVFLELKNQLKETHNYLISQ